MAFGPNSENAAVSGPSCILLASLRRTLRELPLQQRLSSKPRSWGRSERPSSSALELPARTQEGKRGSCSISMAPLLPWCCCQPTAKQALKGLAELVQGMIFLFFGCLQQSKKGLRGSPGISSTAFCICN